MLPLLAHLPNPLIGAFLGAADTPVHFAHPDVVCRPQQRAPLQDGVRVRRVKEAGDGRVDGFVGSRRGALGRASSWVRQRYDLYTVNKSPGGSLGRMLCVRLEVTLGAQKKPPRWHSVTEAVGAVTARCAMSMPVSPAPSTTTCVSLPNCPRVLSCDECSTIGTLSRPGMSGMLGSTWIPVHMATASQSHVVVSTASLTDVMVVIV